ncbi:MAG TPA: hypothetical protein VMK12_11290, partial [Anaeromyxobacteraceae bacterium]|nr:hypothetical protein [Anaeromyxobacteraceae bacterium]
MAFTSFKSRMISAAPLLVLLLVGLPARAASPTDLSVTFVNDADGTTTASLDPGGSATFDATVTRPTNTQDRPLLVTLEYTIPADSTIGSLSGCDDESTVSCDSTNPCITGYTCTSGTCALDATASTFVCNITNPFPYNAANDVFGTTVEASISVTRNTPET